MNKYPKVNYIGNKEKIVNWIIENLPLDKGTVVDLFCGGCSVSYKLKEMGYSVYSNDVLYANYVLAKALIENDEERLNKSDIQKELEKKDMIKWKERVSFLTNKLYFENEIDELAELIAISEKLKGYKKYMFLSLIRRAMIRKIPYSRMNIKWEEIVKLRDEEYSYKKYGRYRHYHNISFEEHILENLSSYNDAIFGGKSLCYATNRDALCFMRELKKKVDIIYIDPPYPSTMNDYDNFYGAYDEIFGKKQSCHLDLTNKYSFLTNFYTLIESCVGKTKYIVISLNNKCYPSTEVLLETINPLIKNYKVITKNHVYKVTGKENKQTNYEILIVCEMRKGDL